MSSMRKTILFIAMSLDGYIADPSGKVDWLGGDGSDPDSFDSYSDFIKDIDTVIMGWNTYRQITTELSPDEWVYSGLQSYVLTHKNLPPATDIIFTSEHPQQLLSSLKQKEGNAVCTRSFPQQTALP